MSITKITVKTNVWNSEKEIFEQKEKEYTKENEPFLDDVALEHISDYSIKDYALDHCDVVDEDDVTNADIDEFDTSELISELKSRGFEVVKCETLADTDRFEKLKENMQL